MESKHQPMIDSQGQALVQVLVSMGIMVILMTATITMQMAQRREVLALAEKLAVTDLSRVMTSNLSSVSSCNAVLLGNLQTAGANTFTIPQIPALGLTAGAKISSVVDSVVLNALTGSPPGMQLILNNPTSATLQINFDQTKLVRRIHDLIIPNIPVVTLAGNITSCGAITANLSCPGNQFVSGLNPDGSPICSALPTLAGPQPGSTCIASGNPGIFLTASCCLVSGGQGQPMYCM